MDEEKFIDVTEGPDRGARLKVPADVAKQAIADGWARDANEPFDPEKAEEVAPEKRAKAAAAAVKGMRKLRGEADDEAPAKDERPARGKPAAKADENGDDEADAASGEYETTDMQPARRGPGRPRK